jgi:DNA polymerase III epsilon subunit-like protein
MTPQYFLICDLEASHKLIASAEILTACFIVVDLQLNVIDVREFKMAPTYWKEEHNESTRIHGISFIEAMNFPHKKIVLPSILEWLKSFDAEFYFTAHCNRQNFGSWSSYDYALLQQEFLDIGMHFEFNQICRTKNICSTHSLAEYAHNNGMIHVPLEIRDGNKKASRNFGLKNICKILNIKLNNHHDANADAFACLNILETIIKRMNQFGLSVFNFIENDWRGIYERTN